MAKREMETGLPPAGDERREVLKEREDVLQEQAEVLADSQERYAVDLSKMEIENELAYYFDELEVAGALPEYAYVWVQSAGNGRHVQRKLSYGWEVVQGNSPEAAALKGNDTTRRLGDVILMRIHKDRKRMLDARDDYRKRQQQEGAAGALQEVADKYARYGARVHIASGDDAASVGRQAMHGMAEQAATRQTDQWLRQGRMPGMPMPQ